MKHEISIDEREITPNEMRLTYEPANKYKQRDSRGVRLIFTHIQIAPSFDFTLTPVRRHFPDPCCCLLTTPRHLPGLQHTTPHSSTKVSETSHHGARRRQKRHCSLLARYA